MLKLGVQPRRKVTSNVASNSAKVNIKSFSGHDSYDVEDNISENADEEGHLISSDSK